MSTTFDFEPTFVKSIFVFAVPKCWRTARIGCHVIWAQVVSPPPRHSILKNQVQRALGRAGNPSIWSLQIHWVKTRWHGPDLLGSQLKAGLGYKSYNHNRHPCIHIAHHFTCSRYHCRSRRCCQKTIQLSKSVIHVHLLAYGI